MYTCSGICQANLVVRHYISLFCSSTRLLPTPWDPRVNEMLMMTAAAELGVERAAREIEARRGEHHPSVHIVEGTSPTVAEPRVVLSMSRKVAT